MSIKLLETKPDPTLKDFYEDKERCADLINVICFNGEKVIDADSISQDSNEMTTIFDNTNSIFSFSAFRDIFVRVGKGNYFVFIGIENQQSIDILIALREFLYTAFHYNKQYRAYQRECRKRKSLGLESKRFKLIPVITPVIYFGEDEWKEDHYISDIMEELPEKFKKKINDWYTKVVDIKKINTSLFTHKDNKDLFEGIIKVYESKGRFNKLKEMKVSRDTAILISTITGMKELVNVIKEDESEEIDMCRSWDIYNERIKREATEIGMTQGLAQGLAQGITQGITQGIAQGIEQGMAQGVTQGVQMGKISIMIDLLDRKIGGISLDVQKCIEKTTIEKIDLLAFNLFSIENEQDILNIIN